MARNLTEKQQRFLDAYLGPARYNATEAARMAGYAGNRVTLAQIGTKTPRTPQVAVAIEAEREAVSGRDEGGDDGQIWSENMTKPHILLARARKRKKLRW